MLPEPTIDVQQDRPTAYAYHASLYNDEYHGMLTMEAHTLVFYVEDTGARLRLDMPTFHQWCTVYGAMDEATCQAILARNKREQACRP